MPGKPSDRQVGSHRRSGSSHTAVSNGIQRKLSGRKKCKTAGTRIFNKNPFHWVWIRTGNRTSDPTRAPAVPPQNQRHQNRLTWARRTGTLRSQSLEEEWTRTIGFVQDGDDSSLISPSRHNKHPDSHFKIQIFPRTFSN